MKPTKHVVLAVAASLLAVLASFLFAAEAFAAPAGRPAPTWMPVNVSFVPPMSTNALYRFHTVNAFSLDVMVGYADGLEGLELSGLGAVNGETRGAAVAGLFNWSSGPLRGVQISGVTNFAGGDARGVQLAGVTNVATDVIGLQLAPVNVARSSTVQLGLVNVADDADVAIGLLSVVKNGTRNVSAAATEFGTVIEADTGGRVVYAILSAGAAFRFRAQPQRYLLGGGLGARPFANDRLAIDVQAVSYKLTDENSWSSRGLHSARAIVNWRVAGPLAVFAGPTFNVFVDREDKKIDPAGYGWTAGSDVRMWPGFLAGLRVF